MKTSGGIGTSRVEAFSDGVLAIIITLLVLEIKIPELHDPTSLEEALRALFHLMPRFIGFLLSFAFVAVFWINHHRFFTLVPRVDWALLWLNNLLLLFLCFIPFPTGFIGENPRNPIALILFAFAFMSAGIVFNCMWRYAHRNGLVSEQVPDELIHKAIRRGLIGPVLYFLGGMMSFVLPVLSWILYGVVPILYGMPQRFVSKED